MKIAELLKTGREMLGSVAQADLVAEVLLSHAADVERQKLIIDSQKTVDGVTADLFLSMISRHERGEPVAYITGHKEFYGLDFFVDRRVLIPRPETEHLVDAVLEKVAEFDDGCRILDIGTGSGCIAVTLAKKNPRLKVSATDVSADALDVAGINAKKHGVEVNLINADLMKGVESDFEIVVANLPYIGEDRFNFVSREAREYEPHVALFGGTDGLRLYEKLFEQIMDRDSYPRYLTGEFGFLQGDELRLLLEKYFAGMNRLIIKDYASIERIFVVEFPPYNKPEHDK